MLYQLDPNHQVTLPTQLGDFHDWHQGIKEYGFWAIEVQQDACLNRIQESQHALKDLLHRGYQRQPHIKLLAAGLVDSNHYCDKKLKQHITAIKQAQFKSFNLSMNHIDSFSTCPYLAIEDQQKMLSALRQSLDDCHEEDSPCHYIPHVTLGFYNKAYEIPALKNLLQKLNQEWKIKPHRELNINVTEIIYAQYLTQELQGPYRVLQRIPLIGSAN